MLAGYGLKAQLQAYIRNDGTQVCIATALAKPVDGSLNMGGAAAYRHNGVRHSEVAVVMAVDSQG